MVEGELPEGLADYASSGGSIVQELGKALIEGGDYAGAEKAWANFRKKEIEAQLGVSGKESVFYEKKNGGSPTRTTIQGNVTVKVSFIEGKKDRVRRGNQRGRPRYRCRGQNDPVRPLLTLGPDSALKGFSNHRRTL